MKIRISHSSAALRLIERAATDERNFVKKAVSWALRGIGRRNRTLNAAAADLARRLSTSKDSAARWIGKDALKELTSPAVLRRLRAQLSSRVQGKTRAENAYT